MQAAAQKLLSNVPMKHPSNKINTINLMNKYLVPILITICLPLFPLLVCSSQADQRSTPELVRVLKQVKEKEKTLKTFIAAFLQTKKSHLLRETLTSEGLIYVDIGGKILIKVLHPSQLTLLLKDNMQIIVYPDSGKAKKKITGRTDHILAKYLGVGQPVEMIQKRFEISLGDKISSEKFHLKMIPKNAVARYIDLIEVEVNRKNGLPEHIYFKEKQGDYTDIRLEYKSINEPIPASIFSIKLPEDSNNGEEER
jgi:outer membrane lipoprotein-sorting protein